MLIVLGQFCLRQGIPFQVLDLSVFFCFVLFLNRKHSRNKAIKCFSGFICFYLPWDSTHFTCLPHPQFFQYFKNLWSFPLFLVHFPQSLIILQKYWVFSVLFPMSLQLPFLLQFCTWALTNCHFIFLYYLFKGFGFELLIFICSTATFFWLNILFPMLVFPCTFPLFSL